MATQGSNFWVDLLYDWAEINFHEPQTAEEISNQIIWCNSHIKQGNKLFVAEGAAFAKGVMKIRDLMDNYGNMMHTEEFCLKHDLNVKKNVAVASENIKRHSRILENST